MSRRTLSDFKYAVTEREKATKAAEKTLAAVQTAEAALEAAVATHEKAVAVLEATERTFDIVQGYLVTAYGGRAFDENCDPV
jgi:hypothetical protein